MVLYLWICVIRRLSKSTDIPTRVNTSVNRLLVIMMPEWLFVDCNKYTSLGWNINDWMVYLWGLGMVKRELCFSQFFCASETVLWNKIQFLKCKAEANVLLAIHWRQSHCEYYYKNNKKIIWRASPTSRNLTAQTKFDVEKKK